MYRSKVNREMEAQNLAAVPTKFMNKLWSLPVVKFGFEQASGIYSKVKDFNTITHRSFALAESVTGAVVDRVTPLAQRGIHMKAIGKPLERIDSLAAQGLETFETKVPIIKKSPESAIQIPKESVKKIYSEAKHRAEEITGAVKSYVSTKTNNILESKPVQSYFDILEFVLSTANSTVNKVLPEGEDSAKTQVSNPKPERGSDRGWWLFTEFTGLLGTTKNRILGKIWKRIDKTSNAADAIFQEAKNAVSKAMPAVDEVSTASNSEEPKSAPSKSKKKHH